MHYTYVPYRSDVIIIEQLHHCDTLCFIVTSKSNDLLLKLPLEYAFVVL
jgi:hypothetical protein